MSFDRVSLRIIERATLGRSQRWSGCEAFRANVFVCTAVNQDSCVPSTRRAHSKISRMHLRLAETIELDALLQLLELLQLEVCSLGPFL